MIKTYVNEKQLTLFFFLEILHRFKNRERIFFSEQMQFTYLMRLKFLC